MKTRFLGVIPSRYASSRFPGKPLARLGNKPMIQWVWERAAICFTDLVVATDDERIYMAVRDFGGRPVMTSPDHKSGTERCAEALDLVEKEEGKKFSHVVNIQGDEPTVNPDQLELIKSGFSVSGTDIATLIHKLEDPSDLTNPNVVKVVRDIHERALYFSRSPIPYLRDGAGSDPAPRNRYFRHLGLYAYRSEILRQLVRLDEAPIETMESLEQLRWLYHGYTIRTLVTGDSSIGVDTPEDLERLRKYID